MKLIAITAISLCLCACSAVDVATTAIDAVTSSSDSSDSGGVAVDTEIVAGNKNQSIETGQVTKSATTLDDVTVKDGGTIHANTTNTTKDLEQKVDASHAQNVTTNNGVSFGQAGIACFVFLIIGWLLPQLRMTFFSKKQ